MIGQSSIQFKIQARMRASASSLNRPIFQVTSFNFIASFVGQNVELIAQNKSSRPMVSPVSTAHRSVFTIQGKYDDLLRNQAVRSGLP